MQHLLQTKLLMSASGIKTPRKLDLELEEKANDNREPHMYRLSQHFCGDREIPHNGMSCPHGISNLCQNTRSLLSGERRELFKTANGGERERQMTTVAEFVLQIVLA